MIWNGPLPDPGTLKEYESLVPGMANQLLEMTVKEQEFRHKNTEENDLVMRTAIRFDAVTRLMIPIFSFLISCFICGLAYFSFTKDLEWAGSILSVSSIGGIIYSFSRMMRPRVIEQTSSPKKQDKS